jgi:hypothetical protein
MDVVGDDHAKIRSQKKYRKKAAKMVDIFVSILGESRTYPNLPKLQLAIGSSKTYENSSLV